MQTRRYQSTRELTPLGPDVVRALEGNPHVKPELLQSTIELNTGVCADVKEVQRDLVAGDAQGVGFLNAFLNRDALTAADQSMREYAVVAIELKDRKCLEMFAEIATKAGLNAVTYDMEWWKDCDTFEKLRVAAAATVCLPANKIGFKGLLASTREAEATINYYLFSFSVLFCN